MLCIQHHLLIKICVKARLFQRWEDSPSSTKNIQATFWWQFYDFFHITMFSKGISVWSHQGNFCECVRNLGSSSFQDLKKNSFPTIWTPKLPASLYVTTIFIGRATHFSTDLCLKTSRAVLPSPPPPRNSRLESHWIGLSWINDLHGVSWCFMGKKSC